MTLDDIWSDFTSAMAEADLMLRKTRSATKTEMKLLLKNEQAMRQHEDDGSRTVSMHNFTFRDIKTGKHIFYDQRDLSIEEAKRHLLLRKNKQYQWLLVEAYEAFEKFLAHLYALVGAACQDCWPMKDYGNVTIAESEKKTFPWYLEQSKRKKDLPHSILNALRKKYSALSATEINNFFGVHLGFAIALTANLRHQIVHARGWTRSKNDFIADTAKVVGGYNNGNIPEQYSAFAKTFFGTGQYDGMIALLEVRTDHNVPIEMYTCRVGILFEILLGYGHALVELVRSNTSTSTA
ncbi:MAG: hypothetical protein EOM03_12625 [Clostridia bacterium]|nr:hypothetical protein [Clostridia bacterium]